MSWFVFAILAAVFLSVSDLIGKHTLHKVHSIELSAISAFGHIILALPFAFFVDWSKVDARSLLFMLGTAVFAAFAFASSSKAFKHLEVSFVSPLLAINPGVTATLAFLVLNEELARQQLFGIILLVIGSYIITLRPGETVGQFMKILSESRYAVFIIYAILFYSVGAILDRYILFDMQVPIVNYIFFTQILIGILFMPAIISLGHGLGELRRNLKYHWGKIILLSLTTFISRVFELNAISAVFVGLVSAIKRSSSFFTTLIGGELFHEDNLSRKLLASAIIIGGAVFIVL